MRSEDFNITSITTRKIPLWIFLVLFALSCNNPRPTFPDFSRGWQWSICTNQSLYVKEVSQADPSWQLSDLPHRVHLPNTALCYQKTIKVPCAGYLYVKADDGAQVFIDRSQVYNTSGYYFEIPSMTDSLQVLIRVLNNAVEGGLKEVRFIPQDTFQLFSEHMQMAASRSDLKIHPSYQDLSILPDAQFLATDITSFSFTAWGDSQGGWDTFSKLSHQMSRHQTSFTLGLGDLVSDGVNPTQWHSFLYCLTPFFEKGIRVFPIVGNHDYDGYYDHLKPKEYIRHFLQKDQSTHSFWTFGSNAFLVLDPNQNFPLALDDKQLDWALKWINSTHWKHADWRFLLIHQPPYAAGWPSYEGDLFIRTFVDHYAESNKIDFVLSGHCHDFEFLQKKYGQQKTNFVVLGGGGGGLEPTENDTRIKMDTIINEHHYALFHITADSIVIDIQGLGKNSIWDKTIVR